MGWNAMDKTARQVEDMRQKEGKNVWKKKR
jgi:hypothetical protein